MSNKETRREIRATLKAMDAEADRSNGEETPEFRQLNRKVAKLEKTLPAWNRIFQTYRY